MNICSHNLEVFMNLAKKFGMMLVALPKRQKYLSNVTPVMFVLAVHHWNPWTFRSVTCFQRRQSRKYLLLVQS